MYVNTGTKCVASPWSSCLAFIPIVSLFLFLLYPLNPIRKNVSTILASLHVCVPREFSLSKWEETEQSLQHCFSEYGVSHVTISPEIGQVGGVADSTTNRNSLHLEDAPVAICSTSQDHFGCTIDGGMKKRKMNANRVWSRPYGSFLTETHSQGDTHMTCEQGTDINLYDL